MDEPYLVLGVSYVGISHLPLNEDVALSLNPLLPQFENVTNSVPLPRYEDVTLCYSLLVSQDEVSIRAFVLLALVFMISGTDAVKFGGFVRFFHGMDDDQDTQSSSWKVQVVSTLAYEALTLQETLLTVLSVELSKLQVILDSIVLFFALHSGLDLNEVACWRTNLATLFIPLSISFCHCIALCLAAGFVMCLFLKLCSPITLC